jgi:hypothetical protein
MRLIHYVIINSKKDKELFVYEKMKYFKTPTYIFTKNKAFPKYGF